MSIAVERRIVDFAEDAVALAESGPGVLSRGLHEAIVRLDEEGLLGELLLHSWIKEPLSLDRGSRPAPRPGGGKGCAFALPGAIARTVRFWLSPKQVVNEPTEVRS